MPQRVRISNESVNDYGTRVLTSGVDISQYMRNPVLLYMHNRGDVIGYVRDIKAEDGEITGELVFDEATELSSRIKRQFEFGSLRMVSAGLDIIETSADPALMLPGQTCATVTRSKLFEVSVVDIGSNDDALVLRRDGVELKLGKNGGSLPAIDKSNKTEKDRMELNEILTLMGLDPSADDTAVRERAASLADASREADALRAERDTLRLEAVTQAVDGGVAEGRIPQTSREHFIGLGKAVGLDQLKATIAAMSPAAKVSRTLNLGAAAKAYARLGEVPEDRLEAMRSEDRDTYIRLFKAEYGFEPVFDEED